MSVTRLLASLNPPQRAAVTLPLTEPPSHALVLAGAGSGKTRVLTTRAAWLMATGQAAAHAILAVTFTNKAAREMRARLESLVPGSLRDFWIGTFHGLCHRLLRLHHREAGLSASFQILDSADQLAAIKRLLKTLRVEDDSHPPRELMYFINANKEAGIRANAVVARDVRTRQRVALYQEYEAQCEREGVADFAELLLRAYELLMRNEPLRRHYQARFRHVLIDEFQDTNPLQYQWLQCLAGGGAALFAVGDDDQSIYAFRGAEIGNMRDFEHRFAQGRVIRLEQNYRSQGNILDAANALIQHNRERLGKNLWTDAGAGELIRVFTGASDLDEARFVADAAWALHEEGKPLEAMAFLYRSNAQSRVLEHELFTRGIPYRVYGGLRFFERQEVKHALAYLRLIVNMDDDAAFLRVVNVPARKIGARTMEVLAQTAKAGNMSLFEAAGVVSGKAGVAAQGFLQLVRHLKTAVAPLPLADKVATVIAQSGLAAYYHTQPEGAERLENLEELVNAAVSFTEADAAQVEYRLVDSAVAGEDDRLLAFLAHASLEGGEYQAGASETAVQLMTVHAAKGLEFDCVFVMGLEEGLFPHENAINAGDLEEERRLMYVAMTRARERLYLTMAETRRLHGQSRYCLASRFLDEIPEALVLPFSPQKARRQPAWSENWRATNETGPLPACVAEAEVALVLPYGLAVGMNVRHARFGVGCITEAMAGDPPKVQVFFGPREGRKWLTLARPDLLEMT
jgi:DNA helicase-2/ATP-dependent DNA helicase PcrA